MTKVGHWDTGTVVPTDHNSPVATLPDIQLLHRYITTLFIASLLHCYIATLPDIHLYVATLLHCSLLHCYIARLLHCHFARYPLVYRYIATMLHCTDIHSCYIALYHWMGKSTGVQLACKCWSDRSFWLTELSQPLYEVESPFRFQVGGGECAEHKKAQKQQHFK